MVPDAVRESAAWEEHYGPLLRADLGTDLRMSSRLHAAALGWRKTEVGSSKERNIDLRFDVFCGLDDTVSKWTLAEGWRSQCIPQMLGVDPVSNFCVRSLAGEHSFMTEQAESIVESVLSIHGAQVTSAARSLQPLAGAAASSQSSGSAGLANGPQPTPLLAVGWEEVGTLDLGFDQESAANVPVVTSSEDVRLKAQEAVDFGGCIFAAHGSSEEEGAWNLISMAKAIVTGESSGDDGPCRVIIVAERTAATGAGAVGASRCAGMEFPAELAFQRVFVDPFGEAVDLDRLWSLAARALPSEPDIRLVPLPGSTKTCVVYVRRLRPVASRVDSVPSLPVFAAAGRSGSGETGV